MTAFYPLFLVIHVVCAIIFIGYIFVDVVMFGQVAKKLGRERANEFFATFEQRGWIMPICVALLALTGGAMITRWINFEVGFFTTPLQVIFFIKMLLGVTLVAMVASSLFIYYVLKRPSPFAKIIHPVAFGMGFSMAILAKIAFYV